MDCEVKETAKSNTLLAEVSRNGSTQAFDLVLRGNKIGDLIEDLKSVKEQTNDLLTKFVNEDSKQSVVRKAENDPADDDDESDEPEEKDSTEAKRLKS